MITPTFCWFCLVLMNSVLLNLSCVCCSCWYLFLVVVIVVVVVAAAIHHSFYTAPRKRVSRVTVAEWDTHT